jgi:aspartate kinase
MIVMKFGGSQLESAAAMRQAASIVQQHLTLPPVVVVSAMGRTAERLREAAQAAARGNSYSAVLQLEGLRRSHFETVREILGPSSNLFLAESIRPLFRELQGLFVDLNEGRPFTPETQGQVLSYGERLSSLIVAECFRQMGIHAAQVDARKVIVTDDQFTHASPLYWETYARLRRTVALIAHDRVVVMGGFIGATLKGVTTTLGRGGSDLTATLVGAGIAADEIQIWTDVDGVLTVDPRVLAGGCRLREISYDEAQEMARFGAQVLCPTALAPALRQRIPIVIRNVRRPEGEGTRVVWQTEAPPAMVKCMTSKTGLAIVHLLVQNQGLLSSITDGLADLFARQQVAIELIQTRERGISFAVANWPGLSEVLRRVDASVEIAVEEGRAAIWLVGQGIAQADGAGERAERALEGMDVRMIAQGSSSLSLGFAMPESQLQSSMEALDREFFATADPEIFAAPQVARSRDAQPSNPHASRPTAFGRRRAAASTV